MPVRVDKSAFFLLLKVFVVFCKSSASSELSSARRRRGTDRASRSTHRLRKLSKRVLFLQVQKKKEVLIAYFSDECICFEELRNSGGWGGLLTECENKERFEHIKGAERETDKSSLTTRNKRSLARLFWSKFNFASCYE